MLEMGHKKMSFFSILLRASYFFPVWLVFLSFAASGDSDQNQHTVSVVEHADSHSVEPQSASTEATASPKTHVVNAEARIFRPDTIYINPGDTVRWTNMTSHNVVSVDGLIPEGASHWRSKLGENIKVTLTEPGIYAYVCEPHIGFGMVGVIVVGKPDADNIEATLQYARDNLKGPYRRLIGKLNKVKVE